MMKQRILWMLAAILTICGGILFSGCTDDNDNPVVNPEFTTLKEALQGIDRISDIKENPDTVAIRKKTEGLLDYREQYSMSFRQDLNHDVPDGDTFEQRVCILFRGFDRPTILVTEGYYWDEFKDAGDLGINLNANMVHVEHRNYGESCNQDQGQWQYQTIAQASADLHAVYQALKPVFKGKWMSAGTSKSGETSIGYAYCYPLDMNLAAAFCSPFVIGQNDERFGYYVFNEAGSAEEREWMKTGIRKALKDGEEGLYKAVCEQMKTEGQRVPVYTEYVFNLFDTFFQVFQSIPQNDGRQEKLEEMATNDEVLVTEVSNTIGDNRDETIYPYFVESAKEMGWQDNGYDYFADLLEGTNFNRDDVLSSILKPGDRWVVPTYDSSTYTGIVNNFFLTSTMPLLLFYVHDDPWSAGMPKQVGPNVKLVVNPIGCHSPYLNDPKLCPAATKQEVMNFVSTYIY